MPKVTANILFSQKPVVCCIDSIVFVSVVILHGMMNAKHRQTLTIEILMILCTSCVA